MKSFRILALLSTTATYFLIFIGGLVRVSGAGLGCPDWPKCFGSWIPPLSAEDIPSYIDPSQFNITLAWIEYGNRLIGMSLGLLILALAVQAFRKYRHNKAILYPSVIALLLVAFQGWQGGAVVSSQLESILISSHLMIALVLASLLIWITSQAYAAEHGDNETPRRFSKEIYTWVVGLYLIAIAQIVIGTMVRSAAKHAEQVDPSIAFDKVLAEAGTIVDVHMLIGNLTTIITVIGGLLLVKRIEYPPVMITRTTWLLVAVSILQAVLGFVLLGLGMIPLMQLYHLWFSAIQVGLLLFIFCGLRLSDALPEQSQHTVGQAMLVLTLIVALLGFGAQWVISSAEDSRAMEPVVGYLEPGK